MYRRRIVPLLVPLVAAACASPAGPTLPAGWRLAANDVLVHEPTGLAFPARWNGLARGEPRTRDAEGADVSIGYRDGVGGPRVTLTTYPHAAASEPTPADHFDRKLLALAKQHPGARVEENAPMNLPLGYSARPGFGAFLHWPMGEVETGSFLMLISYRDRFYRIDTVFELDGTQQTVEGAWRTSLAFLRTLEPEASRR
ncbi:MAG: hypothetical protein QNK04_03775 [Myxococcota bacterium]|nr:hypothetical protein [Myxococcota bacterium]